MYVSHTWWHPGDQARLPILCHSVMAWAGNPSACPAQAQMPSCRLHVLSVSTLVNDLPVPGYQLRTSTADLQFTFGPCASCVGNRQSDPIEIFCRVHCWTCVVCNYLQPWACTTLHVCDGLHAQGTLNVIPDNILRKVNHATLIKPVSVGTKVIPRFLMVMIRPISKTEQV